MFFAQLPHLVGFEAQLVVAALGGDRQDRRHGRDGGRNVKLLAQGTPRIQWDVGLPCQIRLQLQRGVIEAQSIRNGRMPVNKFLGTANTDVPAGANISFDWQGFSPIFA